MHSNAGDGSHSKTSRAWFITASVFLVAFAFFWSLDGSIAYILSGLSVFFIFLGFWNRTDRTVNWREVFPKEASYTSSSSRNAAPDTKARPAGPSQPDRTKKIVTAVVIFFGGLIFLFMIIGIFAGDSESDTIISYSKAEQFRFDRQYDSAAYYYRQVLNKDPEHVLALSGYADLLTSREEYDSALGFYDRILEVQPGDPEARYGKALIHYYRKDFSRSRGEAFALLEEQPEYLSAMTLAADNYYQQQQYDSAFYWYDNAYGKGQRTAWLCHVMGYLNDRNGNTDKAVSLYREALHYDTTNLQVYDRLSELFPGADGGQYRAAAQELRSQGY
jgi:tetratricopeptide (TPR) repeat protein